MIGDFYSIIVLEGSCVDKLKREYNMSALITKRILQILPSTIIRNIWKTKETNLHAWGSKGQVLLSMH